MRREFSVNDNKELKDEEKENENLEQEKKENSENNKNVRINN